jgi:chromosome partitioning protein
MKTIAFVNQKGGAGKSTLCQELAVCADLEGKKVAILDHDEQGSITQWGKDRDKETPVIIPVKGKPLSEFIALANEKNYDFVFIDTAGKDSPSSYEAMEQADLCLVPLRARKKDIYPARVNIEASMKLGKDLIFVMNHCPPRLRRDLAEKANSLGSYGTLCPVRIGNRVTFQDADDEGEGAIEHNPSDKAALEIQELWKWVKQFIRKTNPTL